MEKLIKIKVSEGNYLYGKFQGSPNKPLFIMVHGLPGNMDEEFYHNATSYFAKHNFSTFRFNLYDWRPKARQLIDCTLRIHASDIDTVVRYFRKKGFSKIFVAGHSFGGPSILLSEQQKFDAVALWDPSYDISFTKIRYGFPGGKYIKEAKGYLMSWGATTMIGKTMADETDSLNWAKLTSQFNSPFLLIFAGKGVLVKKAQSYFKNGNVQKQMVVIKGATHYFDETDDIQRSVFDHTLKWFNKFL